MSEALLAYAHDRNVTRIVVGKPRRTRWQRVFLGSIVDTLVMGSGDIDVHVIGGGLDDGAPVAPVRRAACRPTGRRTRGPGWWWRWPPAWHSGSSPSRSCRIS